MFPTFASLRNEINVIASYALAIPLHGTEKWWKNF